MIVKLSHRWPHALRAPFLAPLLALLLLATVSLPAQATLPLAPPPPSGVTYVAAQEIHLDFQQNTVNALWAVRIQKLVNGHIKSDETHTEALKCRASDTLQIKEGIAHFYRQDKAYISCWLPSLRDRVDELTNGGLLLAKHCRCKEPWVSAHLQLRDDGKVNLSDPNNNPIFYHPDFAYFVPYNNRPDQAYLRVDYPSAPAPLSAPFTPAQWNTLWSGENGAQFVQEADFAGWAAYFMGHSLNTLPESAHWANGVMLTVNQGANSGALLSTQGAEIFFGYNPDTQTFFNGAVTKIDWDPSCPGLGI